MQLAHDIMAVKQNVAKAGSHSLHGEVPLPYRVTLTQRCIVTVQKISLLTR